MKSKTTAIILLFIFISLAILLLILWLVDFFRFNIPELIPRLQVRTYGLLILVSFILIFIFLQRSLLKHNGPASVLKLIFASTIVSFVSLFVYQAIRQLFILRGQFSYDLSSVLLSSAVPTIALIIVAASVALELKKVKGVWKYAPTFALVVLFLLAKQYLHKFEW